MKFGTEEGSLGFPTIATSMVVTRPLPLFSYATTVGIYTSLLLFTALFLPRTSSAIFNDTSDFPFLQSASSLDRPQLKFLEALTASPPLTLAWSCAGVFLISLSWSGRIRHQAYEQHKPVNRTDFEAKKEEMEWRKQGTVVGYSLLSLSPASQASVEPAQVAHFDPPGHRHLPRADRDIRRTHCQVRRTLPSAHTKHSPKRAATISIPSSSRFFCPFSRISPLPTFSGPPPSPCSRTETLTSC